MRTWLRSLFRSEPTDGGASKAVVEQAEDPLAGLLEATRKITRSNAKLALRLEEVERKVDAGFADVRARAQVATAETGPAWNELLDALDALERAAEAARERGDDGMRDGLRAVSERLERALAQGAITRHSETGGPPDGRLFRVVGTEHHAHLPDGAVVRVVRAAARSGALTVREGEVVVNKKS